MTRERHAIALLVDSLRSEYTALIWQAVKRAATARNVDTIVYAGERIGSPNVSAATQNKIYDLVGHARVDGVIVVSSVLAHFNGSAGIAEMCQTYAPMALCSIGLAVDGVPSLVVDNRHGMNLGTSHILDAHGCRNPAFIAAQVSSSESNLRFDGFRDALAQRGLEFNDRLVYHGDFTPDSGREGMNHLLSLGIPFDAVVAANDYMAMGALDALNAAGRHIPDDLVVIGFDDISAATCTQPTLSTLRQPMWWLANEAVDTILRQLEGQSVPMLSVGSIELVRRESCGCGVPTTKSLQPLEVNQAASIRDVILAQQPALNQLMRDAVHVPGRTMESWTATFLEELINELHGQEGRFVDYFHQLLDYALGEGVNLDGFQQLITSLRLALRRHRVEDPRGLSKLEHIWHAARILVSSASMRSVGRQRIDIQHATFSLGRSGERLATAMSLPLLKEVLLEELPALNIERSTISLLDSEQVDHLKPLLVTRDGQECPLDGAAVPPKALAPEYTWHSEHCTHSVVVPLTFEAQYLGVAVLGADAEPNVYESLRQQIGSGIEVTNLHRQVVTQVAIRERLEQQRVSEEARLASEIQASMAPKRFHVAGLDIAHLTQPAAEAGGDYYDVLPDDVGAWIGIGDVSGHGLGAGLVMLMLQSMISSLVRSNRDMLPHQMATLVNEALYENVRHRLGRDDHATLTLFRYSRSGHVRFAGCHEPVVVYRAATRHCESIMPPGFWVGAVPDVRDQMKDAELTLQDGDILVLYTDGVLEPRNAHMEQFGLERLMSLVESTASRSVAEIRDALLAAVGAWSSNLDDDITLLVARYSAVVS